jgi:hypothetical protein
MDGQDVISQSCSKTNTNFGATSSSQLDKHLKMKPNQGQIEANGTEYFNLIKFIFNTSFVSLRVLGKQN